MLNLNNGKENIREGAVAISIDNGVYIIKDKKGYRVIETQCIDNLWWWDTKDKNPEKWEKRDKMNPEEVEAYFKDSKYYKTLDEAYKKAIELYKETIEEYGMCEYGIQNLGEV